VAALKHRTDLAMRASSLLKPKKQAPALAAVAEPANIAPVKHEPWRTRLTAHKDKEKKT
jgi:hypothetical protein